jgi:hypothetical protein
MRTPAGAECRYYYQDFHRGRSTQECRLLQRNLRAEAEAWHPKLCTTCPVPGILRANTCLHMVLEAQVTRRWFGLIRRVTVYAICAEHQVEVTNPYVGCGRCHPQAALVLNASETKEQSGG